MVQQPTPNCRVIWYILVGSLYHIVLLLWILQKPFYTQKLLLIINELYLSQIGH